MANRSAAKSGSSARNASARRVLVVASRYNATVIDRLIDGAVAAFSDAAGPGDELEVAYAPGSFEIPAIALAGADAGRFDGVVALGCIIKGDTIHDRVLADAVTQALVQITLLTGVPVTLGVLTVNTPKQALERAGGRLGNKGAEAMSALFDAMNAIDQVSLGAAPAPAASARPDKLASRGSKKGGR